MRCGDDVVVRVRDTGRGIAPEYLSTIFDKFVQVKHSMSTTPGSVGLGLAIAKEIVELYGGTIWVESVVGKGSTLPPEVRIGRGCILPPDMAESRFSAPEIPSGATVMP